MHNKIRRILEHYEYSKTTRIQRYNISHAEYNKTNAFPVTRFNVFNINKIQKIVHGQMVILSAFIYFSYYLLKLDIQYDTLEIRTTPGF